MIALVADTLFATLLASLATPHPASMRTRAARPAARRRPWTTARVIVLPLGCAAKRADGSASARRGRFELDEHNGLAGPLQPLRYDRPGQTGRCGVTPGRPGPRAARSIAGEARSGPASAAWPGGRL